MADLEQLTELARDAERSVAPDFEKVVARARTQRRRKRAAAVALALAVVASGAAVATLPDRTETAPPVTRHREPHHLTARERIWEALDKGDTRFVAAADPDHVLVSREYCPRPRHCWWGSQITGAPASTRPAAQVHDRGASAGRDGFLVGGDGPFLDLDGHVHRTAMRHVPLSQASRPGPGAVFTMLDDNGFLVYEPTGNRYWAVDLAGVTQPPIQQLLLTGRGTIWMEQYDGIRPAIISSSDDGGRSWTHHTLPQPKGRHLGRLLWHAGTIGVPVYGPDGVLRSIEVLEGGRWTDVRATGPLVGLAGRTSPVGAEPNIAGLTDGSLYVRDNASRLWQATPGSWTRWRVVGRDGPLTLTGSGDVLLGVGDDHHTVFRWTGAQWQVVS